MSVIFGPSVLEADISYVRSMQVCRKAMERFANVRKWPANTSIKAEQTSILPNTLSFHFPPSLISMLKNSLGYIKLASLRSRNPAVESTCEDGRAADEANGRGHYQSLQNAWTLKEPFYISTPKPK